jgi:SAM-dependent methyltransferase
MRFDSPVGGATSWRKQSAQQSDYPALELLVRGENDLRNYNERIVELFVAHAGKLNRQDAKILDFGAGFGGLSRIFQQKTGLKPDGVELDDRLRRLLCDRGYRGYESLAAVEDSYDVIFSSNVLEHIEDDVVVLRALREKLKDGGVLLLYVPAFEMIWSRMDDRVGHYRRYTKRTLAQRLESAGYQVGATHYCDSLGFILSILFKLFGSRSGEPSSRSLRLFDRYLLPISMMCDIPLRSLFGKNIFVAASKSGQRPFEQEDLASQQATNIPTG